MDNSTSTSVNLSDGLIATYPFNGNANDESGNQLNGSITGNVPFVQDRFGNTNKAVQFDGDLSNYISVPHNDLFNFTSTTSFSISFWMNCATTSNHFVMVSKGRDVHSGFNSYGISKEGFIVVQSFGQGLNTMNEVYLSNFQNSQWNHIVCIANVSEQKLYYYLNGNLVADSTYAPISINNFYPLVFGRHFVYPDGSGGAEYPYLGLLDDISIYNRALNQNEIKALYGDTLTNLNNGLVAMYPFNGNANDESGHGYNGTVTGANLISDRFGNANSAYYFGGNNQSDKVIKFDAPYGLSNNAFTISLWANADGDVSSYMPYPVFFNFVNNTSSITGEDTRWSWGGEWIGNGYPSNINGKLHIYHIFNSPPNTTLLVDTAPVLNTWNHLAFTFNPTSKNISAYLNGQFVSNTTFSNSSNMQFFDQFVIGRQYDGGGNIYSDTYFKGVLDDINIYNRVLNSNEIKALSNTIQIQNPSLCSVVTITSFIPPTQTTITSFNTVTVTKTVFHTVTVPTYITISPVNQSGRELENDINAFLNPNSNSISVTSSTNSVYNVEILTGKGISISINYTLDNIDLSKLSKGDYFLHAKGFDGTTLKSFRILIE